LAKNGRYPAILHDSTQSAIVSDATAFVLTTDAAPLGVTAFSVSNSKRTGSNRSDQLFRGNS
jgi:hypothetical protein